MEQASRSKTLLPKADLMVPSEPSTLSLADALRPEDFYQLNSLNRVYIDDQQSTQIALNDLVLELSHFVDNDTVRKIELGLLESRLK